MAQVCQKWSLSWSIFYAQPGRRMSPLRELVKRAPKTLYTDKVLTLHIPPGADHLTVSREEGHHSTCAQLRAREIRTSNLRVLRLMRQRPLGFQPGTARRGASGPRWHDHHRTPEDMRHRCDQPRDTTGRIYQGFCQHRSLSPRRNRSSGARRAS